MSAGFLKGDRVQFSREALAVLKPHNPDAQGTVYSQPQTPQYVRVLWDGQTAPQKYTVEYIERVVPRRKRG